MNIHLRYISALALLAMVSCAKDNLSQPENPQASKPQESIVLTAEETERLPLFETDYNRSHEEVLALADNLVKQIAKEEQQTKTAISARTAVLSDSIVIAIPVIKSATTQMPQEGKIYVVNFGKKAGFTLVAGDKRVQSAVLAYDGSGDFNVDTDNPGAQLAMELMKEYIQSEIERMEAMRGDSVYNDLQKRYGFGPAASTKEGAQTKSSFQQPQFVAMDGMPGSSPDNPYGTRQGSNWQVVTNGITWYWAPVDQITTGPQHQSQDILNEIYPMIPAQWGQGWPYNVKVVETQGTSKTGCGPVAMAQIMAYHKKPAGYMWNDYGFNLLENIDRDRNYAWSWEAKQNSVIQNIGQLLLDIGTEAGADYAPTGTGLWLGQAAVGFRKMGYACSDSIPYNALKVENNLRDYMPVYMSGARSGGGHAWVVDGLAQRVDFTTVEKYCTYQGESVGYIPVRTINFQFGQKYYHINWGWNGLDNGWYLVGAFNPPSHGDYDRDLRMLTDIN